MVLLVVVGLDRVQSGGGPLNAGELAAELGVDGEVFS